MNTFSFSHRMKWLLKREFWENRGGFFWAPTIIAGVFFVFTMMAVGTAEAFKSHFTGGIRIGVSLQKLTEKLEPEDLAKIGPGIDLALAGYGQIIQVALGFVLFFYLLGGLYDDRRDRSVLFWKSLPVSDRDTVLSKVLCATLVAPVIACAVAIALQFAVLLLMSVYVLCYGINPITVIWGPAEPLALSARFIAGIGLNALWALPAIGWMLLVSAYARSKPFLWAVLVPVGIATMISWFDFLSDFGVPDYRAWQYGVARILGGMFPASWQIEFGAESFGSHIKVMGMSGASSLGRMGEVLVSPSMWIGAIVGIAMIFAAIRLRRWRDDS